MPGMYFITYVQHTFLVLLSAEPPQWRTKNFKGPYSLKRKGEGGGGGRDWEFGVSR